MKTFRPFFMAAFLHHRGVCQQWRLFHGVSSALMRFGGKIEK
jgi:hypothetical protein